MPFRTKRVSALARDVYFNVIGLNRLVFLGCPRHGLGAAECMSYYLEHRTTNNHIDAIFIEGFYYDAHSGVNLDRIRYPTDRVLIEKLKRRLNVIGLETDDTDPPNMSLAEKQAFCDTKRCAIANDVWQLIIDKHTPKALNSRSIICCGSAHLVNMQEGGVEVPSLQSRFDPLDYAVFHCADGQMGQFYAVEGRANPEEMLSVLPVINDDLDEDFDSSSSDSDAG